MHFSNPCVGMAQQVMAAPEAGLEGDRLLRVADRDRPFEELPQRHPHPPGDVKETHRLHLH